MLKRAEDAPTPLKVGTPRSRHRACHACLLQSVSSACRPPHRRAAAEIVGPERSDAVMWSGMTWATCVLRSPRAGCTCCSMFACRGFIPCATLCAGRDGWGNCAAAGQVARAGGPWVHRGDNRKAAKGTHGGGGGRAGGETQGFCRRVLCSLTAGFCAPVSNFMESIGLFQKAARCRRQAPPAPWCWTAVPTAVFAPSDVNPMRLPSAHFQHIATRPPPVAPPIVTRPPAAAPPRS